MRSGTLVRVEPFGLGFIKPADGGPQLAFTFDQIVGYGGQYPSEIGLRVGCAMLYRLAGDVIDEVCIAGGSGHVLPQLVAAS